MTVKVQGNVDYVKGLSNQKHHRINKLLTVGSYLVMKKEERKQPQDAEASRRSQAQAPRCPGAHTTLSCKGTQVPRRQGVQAHIQVFRSPVQVLSQGPRHTGSGTQTHRCPGAQGSRRQGAKGPRGPGSKVPRGPGAQSPKYMRAQAPRC